MNLVNLSTTADFDMLIQIDGFE